MQPIQTGGTLMSAKLKLALAATPGADGNEGGLGIAACVEAL